MYQRALVGKEKSLGPDHTSTLDALHTLGNFYENQWKLQEAEEMYQRAVVGLERVLGPDHTSTLDALHTLGNLYKDQWKWQEAEEMYQRVVVGLERVLGPDHTSTLDAVHALGNLYEDLGKLQEAEEMYQRALVGLEKALGPDHTSTLHMVNDIGNLYKDQGKLKEAEGMYQRALAGFEKALGPGHLCTLKTIQFLRNLYESQGKFLETCMMHYRALMASFEKARDPDHTSTLNPVYRFGISPRQVWITSNDKSLDDAAGRIGGDSDLSEDGKRYAKALARFVDHQRRHSEVYHVAKHLLKLFQPCPRDSSPPTAPYIHRGFPRNFCVWSSMMKRAIQTVEHFKKDDYDVKEMRMLDDLHCGNMEGMTYREALEQYPEEFTYRRKHGLFYRYPGPGGESYLDVINRLRAVIFEVQHTTDHVLLVSHRAATRVLLSYFCGLKRNKVPDLDVPIGMLYMLERKPGGVDFKAYQYNPETDWFDYIPDAELHQSSAR
jgi:broad specificity phosphatase PhoE/Tfp pilus assembly protein PilF